MKKTLIILGLWVVAIVLIAALVVSMGYSFPEALFIGVQFLPGVLAARYFLSKISFRSRKAGIRDAIFVIGGNGQYHNRPHAAHRNLVAI